MELFKLSESAYTPEIIMDADNGIMRISGRAIPEDAESFWAPVLKWFYAYAAIPAEKTQFTFHFEYVNITSAKRVLFLLNKMNEMNEAGYSIEVEWLYSTDDGDMLEVGKDFSTMVDFPFQIKEVGRVFSQAI